jgi:hypothetical protein
LLTSLCFSLTFMSLIFLCIVLIFWLVIILPTVWRLNECVFTSAVCDDMTVFQPDVILLNLHF